MIYMARLARCSWARRNVQPCSLLICVVAWRALAASPAISVGRSAAKAFPDLAGKSEVGWQLRAGEQPGLPVRTG
jgi:uncharacterized membrane protein